MSAGTQFIVFQYQGRTLEFAPTYELFMKIEERVSFSRIAAAFASAASQSAGDIPMSHVSWCMFCVLRHCNVPVNTPMEVQQAIFAKLLDWGPVIGALIAAYFGVAPEKKTAAAASDTAKKSPAPKRSPRRR